ncbi:hypothetical protein [Nocardia araoensis]|uniref:hypothetical protein n=1 Tax=Nocardia araoensis TaxID=228600 RepID=UPI0002E64563|nr:hypothetical protein [Nocardia araoensis]
MKLSWMAITALVVAAVCGCSDDPQENEAATSTSAAAPSAPAATAGARDDEAADGGLRILLGEVKKVPVPADAVLDIRAPAAWGQAAGGIRCTVTDSSGRNEDLRSSDAKKTETFGGTEWVTVWTFSSVPNSDVTVGCRDPESKITAARQDQYLRVVPREIVPIAPPPQR